MSVEASVSDDNKIVLSMDEDTARFLSSLLSDVFEASEVVPDDLRDLYLVLLVSLANIE